MNKAIFIDRDGIINQSNVIDGKPHAPLFFSDFILLNKVKEAFLEIKSKGYLSIVITNQPNLSPKKGTLCANEVSKMHNLLRQDLGVDEIYVCPHVDDDNCNCRKPKIGSIIKAQEKYNLDLGSSFMIGDRLQDIECANNAGLKGAFFVDYNYTESKTGTSPKCIVVKSLYDICSFI